MSYVFVKCDTWSVGRLTKTYDMGHWTSQHLTFGGSGSLLQPRLERLHHNIDHDLVTRRIWMNKIRKRELRLPRDTFKEKRNERQLMFRGQILESIFK